MKRMGKMKKEDKRVKKLFFGSFRDNCLLILKIAVSLLLIYFIFKKIGTKELADALSGFKYIYLLPVLMLFVLLVFIRSYKWYYLLNKKFNVDLKTSAKSLLSGMVLGLLTPGRIGELSRAVFLKKIKNKIKIVGLVIVDRITDVYVLLLLGILGFLYLSGINKIYLAMFFICLVLFLVITSFIFLPAKAIEKIKKKRFFKRIKKIKYIGQISDDMLDSFRLDYKTRFLMMLFSFLFYIVAYYQGMLILNSLGYNLPYFISIIVLSTIIIFTLLPISFGGIGVREAFAVLIMNNFGMPANIVIIFSLSWYLFSSALEAFFGLIIIALDRK